MATTAQLKTSVSFWTVAELDARHLINRGSPEYRHGTLSARGSSGSAFTCE